MPENSTEGRIAWILEDEKVSKSRNQKENEQGEESKWGKPQGVK